MRSILSLLLFILLFSIPCTLSAAAVEVGAQVLADDGFALLRGKRVGVVTNGSAMVQGRHLVDLLREGGVSVVALFAPEHGVRGTAEDGQAVSGGVDAATGARVVSLYGNHKRPTPAMLAGIDLLLFDIQDVGARFYTYISTLGLAMQGAAEAGIPFVVLDRPNPLGGDYISGFVLDPSCRSFTGMYEIPVAHGMTVGELAQMIRGEGMLSGLATLDLRVVPMKGWRRAMRWGETGLPWVATSPNLRDLDAVLLYPGMCFLEATSVSEGRGTAEPFRVAGTPETDGEALTARLRGERLPGVAFTAADFVPHSLPGISTHPKYRDRKVSGVRVAVTDAGKILPVETGIHLLCALRKALPQKGPFIRRDGFVRLAGTPRLAEMLETRSAEEIIASWQEEVRRFRDRRSRYLLYE